MTNAEKFDQVFGIGQANIAIVDPAWWDDQYIQPVQTNMYDQEEVHENCTVQVLTNSITGEVSVGWWENIEAVKAIPFADVAELTDTNVGKWIPVTERLPEVGKSVLVISYGRVCFAKLLLAINNGGFPTFVLQDGLNNPPVLETTAHNEFTKNRITHWMPLPELP